jgi:hypothetical protein
MSPLTPEQRTLRAKINAHKRWAGDEDRKANALRAQAGLRAKFVREAQEKWPDLPEQEIQRRADHAYQAHMLSLALKSSRSRSARKAAQGGGDRNGA